MLTTGTNVYDKNNLCSSSIQGLLQRGNGTDYRVLGFIWQMEGLEHGNYPTGTSMSCLHMFVLVIRNKRSFIDS